MINFCKLANGVKIFKQ